MTDADIIDVLREAADALALLAIAGYVSETHQDQLRQLEHECLDAAIELAHRAQKVL